MNFQKTTTFSNWLCLLYLVVSVFSIAGQSIVLVIMLIVTGIYFILNKKGIEKNESGTDLIWLTIPAVYLFSLFYCRDFNRGWNQWLNMAPMVVLCLYFLVFKNHLKKVFLIYGFLCAGGLSIVSHLVFPLFQFPFFIKQSSPLSLFHTAEQNAWILYSVAILTLLNLNSKVSQFLILFIIEFSLLHFGSIRFAAFVMIFYLVYSCIQGVPIKSLVVLLSLSLPLIFFISYSLFPSFNIVLWAFSDWSTVYWNEIIFSWNQFLKHPIAGVGQGDYIHAMWNEYNDHKLTNPDKPYFQFFHLLVSTGILAMVPVYLIWNKYRSGDKPMQAAAIISLAGILCFAPLTSQVSCGAFILPLLITRLKNTK